MGQSKHRHPPSALAVAGDGEGERERRAGSFRGLDPDAPAMLLHDVPSDSQAEAGATARLGPHARAIDLVEPLEHPVLSVTRDADAVILDRRHDVRALLAGPDQDLATVRAELDGVVDEIDDH